MLIGKGDTVIYNADSYTVVDRRERNEMDAVLFIHREREDGELEQGFVPIIVLESEFSQ